MKAPRRKRKPWNPEDEQKLRELAGQGFTARQIAKALGREVRQIYAYTEIKGFRLKNYRPSFAWSAKEDALLKKLYPNTSLRELMHIFDRSKGSVQARSFKLGLRKTDEFISKNNQRFKPGNKPWSTGTKGRIGIQPNCRKHHFTKQRMTGERNPNHKPIGTVVVRSDSYLFQKVTDTGSVSKRWVPVHRLVWIKAHGPIPNGHMICFKPGCFTNVLERITPDKLECISQKEHARRNSIHNLPPELQEIFYLRRSINNLTTKTEENIHG